MFIIKKFGELYDIRHRGDDAMQYLVRSEVTESELLSLRDQLVEMFPASKTACAYCKKSECDCFKHYQVSGNSCPPKEAKQKPPKIEKLPVVVPLNYYMEEIRQKLNEVIDQINEEFESK